LGKSKFTIKPSSPSCPVTPPPPPPVCKVTACSINIVTSNGDTVQAAMDPSRGTIFTDGIGDYIESLPESLSSNLGTWTTTAKSTGQVETGHIWEISCSATDPDVWSVAGAYSKNGTTVSANYLWKDTATGLTSHYGVKAFTSPSANATTNVVCTP